MAHDIPIEEIAKAIYTINRHAKTALKPQHLYHIKKKAIDKLLEEKRAEKVGLHFSNHPKLSNQHSTLLVRVDKYYFHVLPKKEDFETLEHLGSLDQNYRNPRTKMSLSQAKRIIYKYINWRHQKKNRGENKRHTSSYYTPSSLGQYEWPRNNFRRQS